MTPLRSPVPLPKCARCGHRVCVLCETWCDRMSAGDDTYGLDARDEARIAGDDDAPCPCEATGVCDVPPFPEALRLWSLRMGVEGTFSEDHDGYALFQPDLPEEATAVTKEDKSTAVR